ncbi:MAG: hypothetical protein K2N05_00680 [Muribaculaceae bacterium]|nr:hypothetical protein [Muribaculaceae bacterium]
MQNGNNYPQQKGSNPLLIVLIVIGVILILGIGLLVGLQLGNKNNESRDVAPVAGRPELNQSVVTPSPAPVAPQSAPHATQATAPEPAPAPAPKPERIGSFREGQNVMNGIFYYNGGEYGFVLTINISNGSIKSASYYPKNQGAKTQTLKGGSCYLSPDGFSFNVSGKAHGSYTVIEASSSGGSTFYGTMQRGDHYGEVSLTLK